MTFPNENQPIALKETLVDLASFRFKERGPALLLHPVYAHENLVYAGGKITPVDKAEYARVRKENPNDLVNKFGLVYAKEAPLLLHRKCANVLIDVAIDMFRRYDQYTMVMDALRTYESGAKMQHNRPDLVASGLLAKAGNSAHNRALAVDSKLFVKDAADKFVEADEHGHLDDENMETNSRFYNGEMSATARANRLHRLQAWQRASVKNKVPIANLLSEFWDDRVPGSPADMWRVLSCRALCIGIDGNPETNHIIGGVRTAQAALHDKPLSRKLFAEQAYALFVAAWHLLFTPHKEQLETLLGEGASNPPELADFIFHEWLETIHDWDLEEAGFPKQCV